MREPSTRALWSCLSRGRSDGHASIQSIHHWVNLLLLKLSYTDLRIESLSTDDPIHPPSFNISRRAWTSEFGNPQDPAAFDWLVKYSPLENVNASAIYPPVLVVTSGTVLVSVEGLFEMF